MERFVSAADRSLYGFYDDDGHEHFSIFVIAGAETINEADE